MTNSSFFSLSFYIMLWMPEEAPQHECIYAVRFSLHSLYQVIKLPLPLLIHVIKSSRPDILQHSSMIRLTSSLTVGSPFHQLSRI